MNYNIYFRVNYGSFHMFNICQEEVDIIVNAYKEGKDSFTLSGSKYQIEGLTTFKIYTLESDINDAELEDLCSERGLLIENLFEGYCLAPDCLGFVGKDVTFDFIGNIEYGGEESIIEEDNKEAFINALRIKELDAISNDEFDLKRLIKLCVEINSCYKYGNYLAVGMIGRTIINHIPPIFNYSNFNQFASNYGGPNSNKSFKKNMEKLNDSLKNISDRYLHQTIRSKESLPNSTQIDFRQDMDVLLEEIVRELQ